jgi:hypothetical protein
VNWKACIFALATTIVCLICFLVGYHAGTKQSLQTTHGTQSPPTLLNQADELAMQAIHVNSLHLNAKTTVKDGIEIQPNTTKTRLPLNLQSWVLP